MSSSIELRGVRTHNLKNFDCSIPHGCITVVTGVSGSGKSSLAFDTLYAEGQRRYTESLSTYARQFLQRLARPPVDEVRAIQPAVALRQKNDVSHGRSTVATITEIDDHLQLLFANAGSTLCPDCQAPVVRDTPASVLTALFGHDEGTRFLVVATVTPERPEHRPHVLQQFVANGYHRLAVDGGIVEVEECEAEFLLGLEEFPVVIDRIVVREDDRQRIAEAVEAAFGLGAGRLELHPHPAGAPLVFDRAFRCNSCAREFIEPQPALFSFNSSLGACATCSGIGRAVGIDWGKVVPDGRLSILEGAVFPFRSPQFRSWQKALIEGCRANAIPLDVPYRRLDDDQRDIVLGGRGEWRGLRAFFEELRADTKRANARILLAKYRGYGECPECLGTRLSVDARNVRFCGRRVSDIWKMSISDARAFFAGVELEAHVAAAVRIVLEEIVSRLAYLDVIGVGYLTLDRASRTLSGGEMQRIHLTTSLGRSLTDTLYVLDEPTAGLHARDSQRLLEVLADLRDLGNTVVVVEHDPEIIEGADWVVELGPGAGEGGGSLVFAGPRAEFESTDSVTARALAERLDVGGKSEDEPVDVIRIVGASEHNLDDVTAHFPVGRLSVVTGVSGSGKSTLMNSVLYKGWKRSRGLTSETPGAVDELEGLDRFQALILMDQAALGRSSRSNPLSYSKAYDDVRRLFAGTRDAKVAGLTAGDFSFNSPGGRCETCAGLGTVTLEMHFLADVDVPCETCEGRRFTPRVLAASYRGLNILDVLELTVEQGAEHFAGSAAVTKKLEPLLEVGLGYLKLGQATSTLSGGEAQRLKLAMYLARGSDDGEQLFILDEPTIGLHLRDIETLVRALRKLVEVGHTVIAIEHNIDFIAQCDFVLDLGPDAGPAGGRVVAFGAPEVVAEREGHTARFLREYYSSRA